jgi:hypothetical protein
MPGHRRHRARVSELDADRGTVPVHRLGQPSQAGHRIIGHHDLARCTPTVV